MKNKRKAGVRPRPAAKPSDPNLTLEVQNPKLEEAMHAYAKEKTPEYLNRLIEKIRLSRLLVPAVPGEKKQPVPCLMQTSEGELYFPVYTSREHIPPTAVSPLLVNMPYLAINRLVANPKGNAAGIVINPTTDNLVFKMKLVQKIEEVEQTRRAEQKTRQIQLSEEQYRAFERRRFVCGFLPKRFFEQGSAFVDELCEGKEACIDRLFEEAYQQKRMYPYLPEDFSVTVMDISPEVLMVRVELPARDITFPSDSRLYLVWNRGRQRGRYFMIEQTEAGGETVLCEIDSGKKRVEHGVSPVEGAELQRIIDLFNETED